MRFSLVVLVGLAAFGSKFGAYGRAIPGDLALSSSSLPVRNVEAYPVDKAKRVGRGVPLPPPRPVTPVTPPKPITPTRPVPGKPEAPKPVVPEPLTPEQPEAPQPVRPAPPPGSRPNGRPLTRSQLGPIDGVPEEPSCGVTARSVLEDSRSIIARADNDNDDELTPDHATDFRMVYLWLLKQSGVTRENIVFYSGVAGMGMARNFVEANTKYSYFWTIFADKFKADFAISQMDDEINVACSKALGSYARNPIVFNADKASSTSYWTVHEYPRMTKAETITKMKDNALLRSDTDGEMPLPC